MTITTLLAMWAVASVVTSLLMGRWLGERGLVESFMGPVRFRLDDD